MIMEHLIQTHTMQETKKTALSGIHYPTRSTQMYLNTIRDLLSSER